MIKMTENAQKELTEFLKDKEKSAKRIYLAPGGWRGPRLGMALDESNSSEDYIEEVSGFTVCINKELYEQVKGVTVDMTYMGFTVEPEVPLSSGGSACGSCGSSCGTN